jgi:hypothetical protein
MQAKGRAAAAAVAAAWFVFGGCSDEPDGSPTEAMLAHLRLKYGAAGLKENQDWKLLAVVPGVQSGEDSVVEVRLAIRGEETTRFYALTRKGVWAVRADLGEELRALTHGRETVDDMARRCADRTSRRTGSSVNVTLVPSDPVLQLDPTELQGQVQAPIVYENMAGRPRGIFLDTYVYKSGRWERVGDGTLYDTPPKRR